MAEAFENGHEATIGTVRGHGADTASPRIMIARGGDDGMRPHIARLATRHGLPQRIAFNRTAAVPTLTLVTDAVPEPLADIDAGGRKAAFTLRLDTIRHGRLRDACAARGLSAQQLVTQALDAFLAASRGAHSELRAAGAGGF